MPIANDMKNIAGGIEVSYGERVAFLSNISKNTNETLKTFHRQHQKMSTDLWNFLSSDRDNRERVVSVLLGKNKRELKAMAEKLAEFLKESTSATKKETAVLMGQIREFTDLIKKENSELKKETGNLLSSFHASHEAMAKDLRKSLSSEIRGQAEKVKKMLFSFDDEHKAKSDQVKRELYSFNKKLKFFVEGMRKTNRSDQMQAREHWQNLARIMAAKRAGKTVTPAKKIAGEPKEEIAEAKTIGDVVSAVKIKEQILRLISAVTSGLTLVQMGKTLGIPYIRLAKPASELVKQGEIKKEDSKYFGA
jgi:hypothetical protein